MRLPYFPHRGGSAAARFAVDGLCLRGDSDFGNEMKLGIASRFGPHRLLTGKAFLTTIHSVAAIAWFADLLLGVDDRGQMALGIASCRASCGWNIQS